VQPCPPQIPRDLACNRVIELGPPRWEASDQPPKLRHGPYIRLVSVQRSEVLVSSLQRPFSRIHHVPLSSHSTGNATEFLSVNTLRWHVGLFWKFFFRE
jgi:hypothetical protein